MYDNGPGPKLISFVHCKWASGEPIHRLAHLEELLNQGRRSHLRIRDQGLIAKCCDRIGTRETCEIVHGLMDDLPELQDSDRKNELDFLVILA